MQGYSPHPSEGEPFSPEPPRQPRGCLFYGCVTVAVLGLIVLLVLGAGGYFAYRAARDFVQDYAEDSPVPVPVVTMPEGERVAVADRIERFRQALIAGKAADPLVLTAPEINAQIANVASLKGRIAVDFEGKTIRGQVSIPLESLGFPANVLFPGKYLNGAATFSVRIEAGELILSIESLEVKGKPVPEAFLTTLRSENLARDANTGNGAVLVSRIESITIKDGTLVITPKLRPDSIPPEPVKDGP